MKFRFEKLYFDRAIPGAADVAVDSDGLLYVLAGDPGPINVLSSEGKYLYSIGGETVQEGHGIFIDRDDFLYIADSKLHAVFKLDKSGRCLLTLGTPGHPSDTGVVNGNFKTIQRGAGPFNVPDKVCVSENGEIYVTDGYGNSRVHRFAPDGTLLASWGEPGDKPGQFHIPHGVGVENGKVYVADRENSRIQIFDVEGKLLDIWNDIARPDGLAVRDGYVYIPELGYHMFVDNVLFEPKPEMAWARVRVLTTDGVEVACLNHVNDGSDGSFYSPHSMNLDRNGNLYIADAGWVDDEVPRPAYVHPGVQKFVKVDES